MKRKEADIKLESAYGKYETEYGKEVQELLVLTSESVGGGGIRFDGDIWEYGAAFLASVDLTTGEFHREKGFLRWLGERGQEKFCGKRIKSLKIYHVRCRKKIENKDSQGSSPATRNTWMLVEIVGKGPKHPELKRAKEEYKRGVVVIETFCGRFKLEHRFECFNGEVDWLGEKCSVSLGCDKGGVESMEAALAFFKRIYADLEKWDREFRAYAAQEMTGLANDWREDSDEEGTVPITEESFAKRISITMISMEPDGNYTVYCDDDNMFGEHSIVIEGNMETGMERTDIAG